MRNVLERSIGLLEDIQRVGVVHEKIGIAFLRIFKLTTMQRHLTCDFPDSDYWCVRENDLSGA